MNFVGVPLSHFYHARALPFAQRLDYMYLRNLFLDLARQEKVEPVHVLSWDEHIKVDPASSPQCFPIQ